MKLQQIRYFVAVYEEGSFTAAAKRAHATQSGLSMQIKELEETLGTKLFERTWKGAKPTASGKQLYQNATQILRGISRIEQQFDSLQYEMAGTVTVGLMPTVTRAALGPAIVRFAECCPNVELKVFEAYSAFLTTETARQELDFAIVPSGETKPGVRSRHVATDQELFVTSRSSNREHLSPVDLSALQALKLVLPGPTNARRAKIDDYLMTYDIAVDAIIELEAMMGTLDLISCSDWTSILPGVLCAPDLDGRRRKLHPLASPPMNVDYILVESASRVLSPPAERFAEIIQDEIVKLSLTCREGIRKT